KMKVAIYGRTFTDASLPYVQQVFNSLSGHSTEIFIYEKFRDYLSDKIRLPGKIHSFGNYYDLKDNIDVLLSLGGDGTMLDTVSLIRDSQIPIIGINFGRLGFLASINKDNIDSAINCLINREYTLNPRDLLRVESS